MRDAFLNTRGKSREEEKNVQGEKPYHLIHEKKKKLSFLG